MFIFAYDTPFSVGSAVRSKEKRSSQCVTGREEGVDEEGELGDSFSSIVWRHIYQCRSASILTNEARRVLAKKGERKKLASRLKKGTKPTIDLTCLLSSRPKLTQEHFKNSTSRKIQRSEIVKSNTRKRYQTKRTRNTRASPSSFFRPPSSRSQSSSKIQSTLRLYKGR